MTTPFLRRLFAESLSAKPMNPARSRYLQQRARSRLSWFSFPLRLRILHNWNRKRRA